MSAILDLLGAFGLETALVQRPDANRTDLDAVWTFYVGVGLYLGLLVAAVAGPIIRKMFPAHLMMADDRARVQRNFFKILSIVILLTVPAGVGLAALGEPIWL